MRTDRVHLFAAGPKFWSDDDVAAWKHACEPHGVDPIALLKCAAHESGASPAAIHTWRDDKGEVHFGAAGLIQVVPANLSPLGFHGSPLEFAKLTVEEQSKYVDHYLGWFPAMRGRGLAGIYCGLFLPALIAVADAHPDEPLCGVQGPFAEFYGPNICFDPKDASGHRKGYICGEDLVREAENAFAANAVAKDVAARIDPSYAAAPEEEPIVNGLAGATQPLEIPGMNAPLEPISFDEEPPPPPPTEPDLSVRAKRKKGAA